MDKGPCLNCTDRTIGCSITCNKYKEWKAIREEIKTAIRKKKEEQGLIDSYYKNKKDKQKRKYGKRGKG